MMSTALLFSVVVAITSAMSAGHQHAREAHLRIAGTLAAQDLLGRVRVTPYDALPTWDGFNEPVGAMTDMHDKPMPPLYAELGREAEVTTEMRFITGADVLVRGREIRVRTIDDRSRVVVELETFVPEPAGDSMPAQPGGK